MSKQGSAPASPRPRAWVALACVPQKAYTEETFPPGADIALVLDDPPFVSFATVPRRITPDATSLRNYPYIAAADTSGRLLVYATQGRAREPAVHTCANLRIYLHRDFVPAYFLCDAHTGAASRLPDPPVDNAVLHFENVGLIPDHHGSGAGADGHYMVAELQPFTGTHHASLLCYSTETSGWVTKELAYSPDHPKRRNDGVLSHDGKLWWVDLSYGLFTCDPFAEKPELLYVPLPQGCVKLAARVEDIAKCRCVKVSAGKLRCVQIHGPPNEQAVTMWTLDDPVGAQWRREYEVLIAQIWDDRSYQASGMEHKVPSLALVHPKNPDVVYFFQGAWMFGADVRARKVLEYEFFAMMHPPKEWRSSFFVHAWEPPPTLPRKDPPIPSGSSDEEEDYLSLRTKMRIMDLRRSVQGSG